MARRAKSVVKAVPGVPAEKAPPAPVGHYTSQVFVVRNAILCPECGSDRVGRNGGSPVLVAYFVCGRCTDDDGKATTFKVPVA